MLKTVKDLPKVKEMLDKSKEILGWDVLELCLNGPEEKLAETKYCQPAMFIGGLAGLEKLRSEKPECADNPQFVAGLSLGEYTALCAAGVFSFEDGLKLVKLRGEAMQEAAENGGPQGMLSVAGLDAGKLKELCAAAQKEEGAGGTCSIANDLFPNGFSCGGSEKAINLLKEKAEAAGALQAKVLKTGGAFHTSLMQPAQTKLNAALEDTIAKMNPPRSTIYMNATAEPVKAGSPVSAIVDNLKKQLTNSVLWCPSQKKMIDAGITEYYECGPMKQIKAMMKRIDQKVWKTTTNIDV
jgi:[acyl-carrier-protein] S-malonyltransferase